MPVYLSCSKCINQSDDSVYNNITFIDFIVVGLKFLNNRVEALLSFVYIGFTWMCVDFNCHLYTVNYYLVIYQCLEVYPSNKPVFVDVSKL